MIRNIIPFSLLLMISAVSFTLYSCGDDGSSSSLAKSDICYNTAEWEDGWDAIIENSCWAQDWDPDRWGEDGWSIDNWEPGYLTDALGDVTGGRLPIGGNNSFDGYWTLGCVGDRKNNASYSRAIYIKKNLVTFYKTEYSDSWTCEGDEAHQEMTNYTIRVQYLNRKKDKFTITATKESSSAQFNDAYHVQNANEKRKFGKDDWELGETQTETYTEVIYKKLILVREKKDGTSELCIGDLKWLTEDRYANRGATSFFNQGPNCYSKVEVEEEGEGEEEGT